MPSKLFRFVAAGLLVAIAGAPLSSASRADEASPAAPATQAPPGAAPAAPAASPPAVPATNPAPAAPEAAKPAEPSSPQNDSTGETVDLAAQPFAYIEGKADRDEIFGAILGSLALVKRDMEKAGAKAGGRPLAVFIESDDSGFRYHAGYPLDAAPEGKASLSDAVKIGQTPSGRAMRFQHLGAYVDIDATYDAITAYLDEKGIDAQDSFVEQYENDVKDGDDPNLQVNIYVLLK
jgi:effector-binding domain-containing protein